MGSPKVAGVVDRRATGDTRAMSPSARHARVPRPPPASPHQGRHRPLSRQPPGRDRRHRPLRAAGRRRSRAGAVKDFYTKMVEVETDPRRRVARAAHGRRASTRSRMGPALADAGPDVHRPPFRAEPGGPDHRRARSRRRGDVRRSARGAGPHARRRAVPRPPVPRAGRRARASRAAPSPASRAATAAAAATSCGPRSWAPTTASSPT